MNHRHPASRAVMIVIGACLALTPAACKKGRASAEATTKPVSRPAATSESDGLPVAKSLKAFDAFSALGYRPEWVGYPVLPRGRKINFFLASDDLLVVQETGNILTVMDAATGSNRWSLNPSTPLTKFVGSIRRPDGDILCSSESEVFILDPVTGVMKNRQRLAKIVNTPPALVGDILVYGCPTGEVLAHSLTSGYKRWAYALDGAITAPPVRVGEGIAVVSQNGEMVVLEARQGAATGRGQLFGGLANSPVAEGSRVFFAGLDQSVWAYDEYGYQPAWRVRLDQPLRDQPTVMNDRLYVSIPGEGLACMDATNGKRLWTTKGLQGSVVAKRGDRLIFWSGTEAMAIDPRLGDVTERITLRGIDRLVADKPIDGNLYAYSLTGEVHKYSPKK
ncbi:MAG: PQQ-binding-like beta-propeller repeat protein [Phycisphaerae bacterium]|nr:PQQ-binding-like beta-propeller repeat protein [Phycisphaerae bacterium]